MTGPEHYKHAERLIARAEKDLREGFEREGEGALSDRRARRIGALLQAATAHANLAKIAATVQTGRMAPEAGREWDKVLVVPANFAEARGEAW